VQRSASAVNDTRLPPATAPDLTAPSMMLRGVNTKLVTRFVCTRSPRPQSEGGRYHKPSDAGANAGSVVASGGAGPRALRTFHPCDAQSVDT
jgi:hypothetical protein